jgi:hypothetical protein
LELAVTPDKVPQSVCHGPFNDDAQATVAGFPGGRLLQTSTPFWLNEVMTTCAGIEFMPASNVSAIRSK